MRLALLLLALATPAHAACQGDTAFSCRIGKKTLEVCLWKGALIYAYGPENAPELTLAKPLETALYTPWPGVGRAIWEAVVFPNEDVAYEVWTSFDRMEETAVLEGGVNVLEGEAVLATLTCDPGSVTSSLDTISEMKAAIGQCWDFDSQSWRNDCD